MIQQKPQRVSFAELNDGKRCMLYDVFSASRSRFRISSGAFHDKLTLDPSTAFQTGIAFQKYPSEEAPRMTKPYFDLGLSDVRIWGGGMGRVPWPTQPRGSSAYVLCKANYTISLPLSSRMLARCYMNGPILRVLDSCCALQIHFIHYSFLPIFNSHLGHRHSLTTPPIDKQLTFRHSFTSSFTVKPSLATRWQASLSTTTIRRFRPRLYSSFFSPFPHSYTFGRWSEAEHGTLFPY